MGYYIEEKIPDLSGLNTRWVGHFVKAMMGPDGPYPYWALKTNFIRLTDAAIQMYGIARTLTLEYWDSKGMGVQIGAYSTASSYYEACLTNVYRAICHMRALRDNKTYLDFLKPLPPNPSFMKKEAFDKLDRFRNAVQHLEKKIIAGKVIPEMTFFSPVANGPEVKRGNDTIKMLDRVMIGNLEVEFVELAEWLREMAHCAEIMANL